MNIKCSPFCFFLGMGIVLAMWGMCEWMKPTPCPTPAPQKKECKTLHTPESTRNYIDWIRKMESGKSVEELLLRRCVMLENVMLDCDHCRWAAGYWTYGNRLEEQK